MDSKRLGYIGLLFFLWLGTARPQAEFTQSNYRSFDLTGYGITGEVTRVALSPDSKYAAIESRWGKEAYLYVLEIESRQFMEVDPRSELEGYEVWKKSPIAKLYPVSDCEPRWYPSKRTGQQWLLFKSNGIDNQEDLFLFRPEPKSYVRVTESDDGQYNAKWSSNGEYLSFQTKGDNDKLFVVPNMGRVFNEVEKLQMAYNHIPSLADVYSAAIFDRSKDLFFSTGEVILDYDWLASGGIALLQASKQDSAAVRLYYLRSSGKAKFVEDIPNARRVHGGKYFPSALVLVPTRRDERNLWEVTAFGPDDFDASGLSQRKKGVSFGSSDITGPPAVCGKEKYIMAFAGSESDDLKFRTYHKGRERDRSIGIPLSGQIIDIDMRSIGTEENAYTVAGVYAALNRFGLFAVRFEYEIDEDDIPLMERNQFIEMGGQAHFSRYTGDVVAGDFQPGMGLWGELRFTEGFADFSAGGKLSYVPLTGSSTNSDVSFAAYFWAGEIYLKYTYPMSYEIQPYGSLGVGVAASNSRAVNPKEPRKRQTPYFFDFTGGAAFTLNPRMNMHVVASFVKLSDDIDRLAKTAKSDSYILIGIGFSYILSY